MTLPDKFNFSGSPEQLTILLPFAQLVYTALKDLEVSGGGYREGELAPKRTGKILIKLVFGGVTTKGRRKSVEISFRLMGAQDNPKLITLQRIQYISNRIVSKFNSWSHQTGRSLYCYADWDLGYQLQLLVSSQAEAQRIIEQVLDIQGHSPDWDYLSLSKNINEISRYPDLPNKVIIAGRSVRPPQQRSTCQVKFQRALIKFPHIPSAFSLCNPKGNLINNLNFLDDYDN